MNLDAGTYHQQAEGSQVPICQGIPTAKTSSKKGVNGQIYYSWQGVRWDEDRTGQLKI